MLKTSIIAIAPSPAEAYSDALLGSPKLQRKPTEVTITMTMAYQTKNLIFQFLVLPFLLICDQYPVKPIFPL